MTERAAERVCQRRDAAADPGTLPVADFIRVPRVVSATAGLAGNTSGATGVARGRRGVDAFATRRIADDLGAGTRELWKFCAGTGSHVLFAARTLAYWEAEGELPDWWEAGAQRRRH
mgnify:CR=1 FL=1